MIKILRAKRILCLLLVLCLLLSLSGCGIGSAITAAKVAKAVSKLQSVSGDMTLDLELSAYSMEIPAVLSSPVDFIMSPFALQADSQLEIAGKTVPVLKVLMEKDGKTMGIYLGATASTLLGSQEVWTASRVPLKSGSKLSAKTVLTLYMALSDSFSQTGTEAVGGYTASRYDGTLPEKLVSEFFKGSGGMTVYGVEFSEEQLIQAFSNTPVSFWLDSESFRPVKFEADLSRSADILFLGILSQLVNMELEAGINKAVLSFTVSDFDSVDEIVIPQEAKDALENK